MSFETSHDKKYQKIFRSFELDILKIVEESFLSNYWVLPFEKNGIEYRVTLGKIYSTDDLEEMWECKSEEEFLKVHKSNTYLEEFKKDLKNIGKTVEIDSHKLTFSIFLPAKVNLNKDVELAHLAAWQCAAMYFVILKNSTQVTYSGDIVEQNDILHDDNFGKFLTIIGAKINNATIKEALDDAYRLYKDSKFFYELSDYLKSSTYEKLINQLERVKK